MMSKIYEAQSSKLGIVSTGRFGPLNNQCAVDGGRAMPVFVDGNVEIIALPGETQPTKHYIDLDREELVIRVQMPDGTMSRDHIISDDDQRSLLRGTYGWSR